MFDEEDEVVSEGQYFSSHVTSDQQTVIVEGMLKKKSPKGIIKAWQDRWSKLTKDGLSYYKTKDSTDQKGFIPTFAIQTVNCEKANFKKKGFRFDIVLSEKYSGRIFSFVAKTEKECVEWVDQLTKVLEKFRENRSEVTPAADEDPTGGKIWKTKKNVHTARKQELPSGNFLLPYRLINPPTRPSTLDSPQVVCDTLFGDYKVENREAENEFGATFIIGDSHYNVHHRSFLLNAIETTSPYYNYGVQAMNELSKYDHPVFAKHVYTGVTSDTAYSIYHPPLRVNVDSMYQWLEIHQSFPEDVVRYITSNLISALEYVHSKKHLFVLLSPETVFFDAEGNVRIFDTLLAYPPDAISIRNHAIVQEYTPPEVAKNGRSSCTAKSDTWRLGALLYELVTSIPLFRPRNTNANDAQCREDILEQIINYTSGVVSFPPTCVISNELQDFIRKCLDPNPANRPSTLEDFRKHPFLQSVTNWDRDALLSNKPKWIHEKIVALLAQDPDTPCNLTLNIQPIMIKRVAVSILNVIGLPKSLTDRLYCNILVEGDLRRTKVLANDATGWNEDFYFDLLNGTLPEYSDVIIELHSKKREVEGKNSQIGLITVPLNDIRRLGYSDVHLTILGADGLPIGDLHVTLGWIDDPLQLQSILQPLSTETLPFSAKFGKTITAPSGLLWHLIAAPEGKEESKSDNRKGGDINDDQNYAHLNTLSNNNRQTISGGSEQFFTVRHTSENRGISSPSMTGLFSPLNHPSSPSISSSSDLKMPMRGPPPPPTPTRGPPPMSPTHRPMPPHRPSQSITNNQQPVQASASPGTPSFNTYPPTLQSSGSGPAPFTLSQQSSLSGNTATPMLGASQPPTPPSQAMLSPTASGGPPEHVRRLPPPNPTILSHQPQQPQPHVSHHHHHPRTAGLPEPQSRITPESPNPGLVSPQMRPAQPPPMPATLPQPPKELPKPPPQPANPPNPSTIRENWRSAIAPNTGTTYYYNRITKETRWDPPPCWT